MSQSCFSLWFISQNSLWKLSTFCGYKGIYSRVCEECEKLFFCKTRVLATHLRLWQVASFICEITDWPNCPFCSVVLQLSWPFSFLYTSHVWHFGQLSVASHSQILIARMLLNAHTLEIFTLSHTRPLHDFHLNTWYLIAELQANLSRNKANTWLNKFNLKRGNYNTSQSSKKNEDWFQIVNE